MDCLSEWMSYLGLSRTQMSEITGLTPAAISLAFTRGVGVRRGWVKKLADQLGMPIAVMLEVSPLDPTVLPQVRELAVSNAAKLRLELTRRNHDEKCRLAA